MGSASSSHSKAGGPLKAARSHGSDAGNSGAGVISPRAASSAPGADADQQSRATPAPRTSHDGMNMWNTCGDTVDGRHMW